ncbi:unnamed protein product, partial [Adineta ricciae]
HDFFQILKVRQWINEIDDEILLKTIHESVFVFEELIELFRWLSSNEIREKNFIKKILMKIRFRQTMKSEMISLENIQYFDQFNLPFLPLPNNVLPSYFVSFISREDLQRRLDLIEIPMRKLIEFYLNEKQRKFLLEENSSKILLHFISKHFHEFNPNEINQIATILSSIPCICTTKGMKCPKESYIPSENLSSNLPIIQLNILQISKETTSHSVSLHFLKSIGCRTIHIPTTNEQFDQTNPSFIHNLMEQRKNLSENDVKALKTSHCLIGLTSDESNNEMKRKYVPCELYFPSVGNRLQWKTLPILEYSPDLVYRSTEYLFLKELGVREEPDLTELLSHIQQEYRQLTNDFHLTNSLKFFIENFQLSYSKIWTNTKITIAFLPSISPLQQSSKVFLSTPENVFKEFGPLCPSIVPEVLQYFSRYFDIGLIGVKLRPTISLAFHILMDKRNELLNEQTASSYFSYFNKLDGLNKQFIENISKKAFIPLLNNYFKVNEVFLRPRSLKTDENQSEEMITHGLIDYVDYGEESNSFLTSIGVTFYPSAENLANLLIDRQKSYFQEINSDIIQGKLRFYTNCLKQLAVVCHVAQEFHRDPLKSRLRNQCWCLGYQDVDKSDGKKEKIFRIVKPNEIYLDDDHQCAIDLRPLCAPDEPELTKLYELFGAKWISESVQRNLIHRGKVFVTDRSKTLEDLIAFRLDMLFVNNRGERIENLDEKRIELLRNHFNVYESEGIQCQLTFQNKTISLNSSECSSCALEYEKQHVYLFIQKDLLHLDYIDISSELTRFVYKKPIDSLVHSISDKLSSPLETLKRRGIPVDRLLKIRQQQQSIQISLPIAPIKREVNQQKSVEEKLSQIQKQSESSEEHQQQQQTNRRQSQQEFLPQQTTRGFLQNLKSYLNPNAIPSPTNSSNENLSSEIERNRIKHFGECKTDDENDIQRMIQSSRSYSENTFNQVEHSRNEINNSCEFIPSSNMIRFSKLFSGIPLYFDQNIQLTQLMIEQSRYFAFLLSSLVKKVFAIPIETVHLFRDIES